MPEAVGPHDERTQIPQKTRTFVSAVNQSLNDGMLKDFPRCRENARTRILSQLELDLC